MGIHGEVTGLLCAGAGALVEVAAGYLEVVHKVQWAVLLPIPVLMSMPYVVGIWLKPFAAQHGAREDEADIFTSRAKRVYYLCAPLLLVGYFLAVGCGLPWNSKYC